MKSYSRSYLKPLAAHRLGKHRGSPDMNNNSVPEGKHSLAARYIYVPE